MADDYFGNAVGVSGSTGLVGAKRDDGKGAAYVFRNLDTATGIVTQSVKLVASDGATSDNFGHAVSLSDTMGLISAPTANVAGSGSGAAYVFRRLDTATGTVTQSAKLIASDAAAFDRFGDAVSLSGDVALIGATYKGTGGAGAAYVFRGLGRATGTVTESVKLVASDAATYDYFGGAVSLSGSTGLVGASGDASSAGAAYVFRGLDTATGTVTQSAKLVASDAAANDYFGRAVSLSNSIGLIGASGQTSYTGAAYVFRGLDTATGTVMQSAKLVASDGTAGDSFGFAVSLSGGTGLIGAYGNANSAGAAYLFRNLDTVTSAARRDGSGGATESVKLVASDGVASNLFGYAVSLDGDRFVIGAFGANNAAGKSYIGTVSSVTTLDAGSASRAVSGLSFTSQIDWIIGETTDNNQVTLGAGDSGNVTASGKAVYVGKNSGSDNNTLIVAGTLTANTIYIGANGNTGNTLQIGTGGTTGSVTAAIVNYGALVFNRSDDLTFSGAISGSGSLTKNGTGTLQLTGANTYTGSTLVSAGTVKINNSTGSAFGTGAVTVASGATLTGAGSFSGAFQNNGSYLPGNSPALVALSSFAQSSSGTLVLELGGLTRGTQYDALNITGAASFGGTLSLTLIDGFTPASGNTFNLFDWGSVSGSFATLDLPSLSSGLTWDTSALYTDGTLSVSAIPEPSTYAALGGLGALGVAVWRRRKS
jgi:autotransporter-associated beta strand protein